MLGVKIAQQMASENSFETSLQYFILQECKLHCTFHHKYNIGHYLSRVTGFHIRVFEQFVELLEKMQTSHGKLLWWQ